MAHTVFMCVTVQRIDTDVGPSRVMCGGILARRALGAFPGWSIYPLTVRGFLSELEDLCKLHQSKEVVKRTLSGVKGMDDKSVLYCPRKSLP